MNQEEENDMSKTGKFVISIISAGALWLFYILL